MTLRPRILLADDDDILLDGIRKLLDGEFEIVATAANGRELVEKATLLKPDVIVLDIGMPLLNGIEAARQIRESSPEAKLVFLTQQADRAYIREAFQMGAAGYLVKQGAASELITALKEVTQGNYFISAPALDPEIAAHFDPKVNPRTLFGVRLKPRQREILRLLAEGKTTKEIAGALGISAKTVEFYKDEIMEELGISTMAELTRYAAEHDI